jgi:hypothetical protein
VTPFQAKMVDLCNQFIWVHMFPNNELKPDSHQHMCLIRTYFAGAIEALLATEDFDACKDLMDLVDSFTKEDWKPGVMFLPPNYERMN